MEKATEIFKALADNTRLTILKLLSRREMAVCELIDALKLSQPAVSHHLKILKQARLVKDKREGKWIFYVVDKENFQARLETLTEFFSFVQENLQKETLPSPIRTEPCLCEKLREKNGQVEIAAKAGANG